MVYCTVNSNAVCATNNPATSNSIIMDVNPNLVLSAAVSGIPGSPICEGTEVSFTVITVNEGSSPSYQWVLNGVNVGGDSNTYITSALTDGDLVWCIVNGSAVCTVNPVVNSDTIAMTVVQNLPVTVSITAFPNNVICEGTEVNFTATPVNGGSDPGYQWFLNGVATGTDSSVFVPASLNNGDSVSCLLTSSEVCASGSPALSNLIGITVNPIPVAHAGDDQTVCSNVSATLVATGGVTYQWSNSQTTDTIVVNPSVSTVYYVTVYENGCYSMDTVWVNVLQAPSVNLGPDETICGYESITLDAGNGFVAYDWSTGQNSQTITIDSLSAGGLGTYEFSVMVTAANNCYGYDTVMITIESCAGISEAGEGIQLNLFPNPTNGMIYFTAEGVTGEKMSLSIIDMLGQLTFNRDYTIENGQVNTSLDLMNYPTGVYYLWIQVGKEKLIRKIIVQ